MAFEQTGEAITAAHFCDADEPETPAVTPLLARVLAEFQAYFAGARDPFDFPIAFRGTPFQQMVWRELLKIPYGETRSYGFVARAIGKPGAARAVGMACHANPIAIAVPCHRVVNRFGEPSSAFAFGGVNRQILMLEEEGIEVVDGRVDLNRYLWDGRM